MPHILGLSSHPLIYSEVLVWYSCLTLEYAGPCLCNDRRRSLGKQVCRSVRHPGLWGELCPGVEHHGAHVCLNASLIRMQEAQCVELNPLLLIVSPQLNFAHMQGSRESMEDCAYVIPRARCGFLFAGTTRLVMLHIIQTLPFVLQPPVKTAASDPSMTSTGLERVKNR